MKDDFNEKEVTKDARGSKGSKRRNSRRNSTNKRSPRNYDGKMAAGKGYQKDDRPNSRSNDASWWNKFGNLNEVTCNLSWNVMNGAPRVRSYTADTMGPIPVMDANVLPTDIGVSVIETIPGLGACKQIGDPINKAMIEIYNMVRWNKNANVPYDPADIGKLLWAYDSFISLLACMRRFYALTNAVDPRNRYVARSLIYAMGADPDDLYENRANLVFAINQLAIQAAKINIPAEFKVFDRHELLYDNVFIDSQVARGTYYVFVPRVLCKYNDTDLTLDYIDFLNVKYVDDFDTNWGISISAGWDQVSSGTPRMKVSDLVSLGNELLDAIQTSSDFYMLNANIYGAYSERGLHPVKVIDSFYTINPLYREEVLSQIHNSEYYDVEFDTLNVVENVTEGDPDLGALEFTPSVKERSGIRAGYNKIVDMPWEKPSIDDVLEATRLKATATDDPAKIRSSGWYIDSCGTEICTTLTSWYFIYAGGYWNLKWFENRGHIIDAIVTAGTSPQKGFYQAEAAMMTKVDRYPLATMLNYTVTEGAITQVTPLHLLGDIDNYAMIDTNQLHNIHSAALLSVLLNGPTVGASPVQETK